MSVTFFPFLWGIKQLPDIGRSGLIEHGPRAGPRAGDEFHRAEHRTGRHHHEDVK